MSDEQVKRYESLDEANEVILRMREERKQLIEDNKGLMEQTITLTSRIEQLTSERNDTYRETEKKDKSIDELIRTIKRLT